MDSPSQHSEPPEVKATKLQTLEQPGNREALSLWQKVLMESVKAGAFDLSSRQMTLMLTLYLQDGEHTIRSLSSVLSISKPAVCRAVDTLSKYNLIMRKKDASDGRNVFIERTAAGYAYLGQFSESILNHLMEIA